MYEPLYARPHCFDAVAPSRRFAEMTTQQVMSQIFTACHDNTPSRNAPPLGRQSRHYYAPLALTGIEPAYLVCEPTSCRFRWQSHVGAGEGAWTPDLMITNQLLYQLSYTSTHAYLKRTIKYLNGIADPLRLISCFVHSNILLFTYLSPKVSYIDPWWCRCSGRITQHWTHGDLFLLR